MFRIPFILNQIFIVIIDGVISAYGRPGACFKMGGGSSLPLTLGIS
jgi:hypothetical protein